MPGLDFQSPVPPVLPSDRIRDEPGDMQASRVWLALLERCQKDARCGDLDFPNNRDVAMLCQSGHAEMLMTVMELHLQRNLEIHVAKFWGQLNTAWKTTAGIEDSLTDQASGTPRAADEKLFAVLVCVLKDLSAVVHWQCDMLRSLSDQVLACYTRSYSSEEHAVGVSGVHLPASALNSPVDVAAHADNWRIKAVTPAFLARLADLSHRQRMLACSTLHTTAVVDLQGLLQSFFTHCIDVLQQSGLLPWRDSASSHMDADAQMMDGWEAESHTALLASQVTQVSACLQSLGMSSLLEEACTYVVYNHVQIKVDELAMGVFDREVLKDALQHVQLVPLAFLKLTQSGQPNTAGLCEEWRLRLMCLVYEGLGAARISELFDIIIEYPDSQPALNDIAACLRYTSLQFYLVSDLRLAEETPCVRPYVHSFNCSAAISARLLHAGASASSIIHTYISTIKALGSIEPSGLLYLWCGYVMCAGSLLAAVAEPIRRYLRNRPDAIRVLVAMVTAGGQGDGGDVAGLSLRSELQKASLAASISAEIALEDPDEAVLKAAREDANVGSDVGLPPAALAAMQDARSAGSSSARIGSMASTGHGAMLGSMHAQPAAPAKPQGGADDIIGALIGVFGSVDVFISEYRSFMGMQLLAQVDYDCESALCTTELLKLRFGEAPLHACEVMLKDVADSKRANTSVHAEARTVSEDVTPGMAASDFGDGPRPMLEETLPQASGTVFLSSPTAAVSEHARDPMELPADEIQLPLDNLSAAIISHMFWPAAEKNDKVKEQEAKLVLPPEVRQAMDRYAHQYEALKTPRQLRWRPQQGLVVMDVEVEGVKVELRVSPLMATLLLQFRDAEQLTAAELSDKVGLPQATVRQKIAFWVNHDIVLECRLPQTVVDIHACTQQLNKSMAANNRQPADQCPVYKRAMSLSPLLHGKTITDEHAEDELSHSVASPQDALLEEMAPYENYVMGMLTTYKQLPLDRLHHMLKLFVIAPKFDKTVDQLGAFLSHLVAQGKVALENSQFRRPPAPPPPSEN